METDRRRRGADALPKRHARLDDASRRRLEALRRRDVPTVLDALFEVTPRPMTVSDLAARTQIERAEVETALGSIPDLHVIEVGADRYVVPARAHDAFSGASRRALNRHHQADPKSTGLDKQALRDQVLPESPPSCGTPSWPRRPLPARPRWPATGASPRGRRGRPRAGGRDRGQAAGLPASGGGQPPDLKELPAAAGVDAGVARKVLPKMLAAGSVVRITPGCTSRPRRSKRRARG